MSRRKRAFHAVGRRLDGSLLVLALISATLVKGGVGEALVLHRHGVNRTHLHVVARGDAATDLAYSSSFGHRPGSLTALQSPTRRVHVLAIIETGAVFVSAPRSENGLATHVALSNCCSSFSTPESQVASVMDAEAASPFASVGGTSAAAILLRNHTLLL